LRDPSHLPVLGVGEPPAVSA